jgi:tRNA 2-thiouridine synthesizing protein A
MIMEKSIKPDIVVDVTGETCPIPLVEMRKAVLKAGKGDVIEVKGTHEASQQEIPMAVESLHLDLLSSEKDADGTWHIFIKK